MIFQALPERLTVVAQAWLPFRIDEVDVSLTDLGLALETAVFAVVLARQETGWRRLRGWGVAFFGSAFLASLAGGIDHGFLRRDGRETAHDIAWVVTLLAIGGSALALARIGTELGLDGRAARGVNAFAAIATLAYALVVLFGWREFLVAILAYAPAAIFLLVILLRRSLQKHERASLLGIAAVLLAFAAAAIQQLEIGVDDRYLGHNALYHVVQAGSFALLFVALRQYLSQKGRTAAARISDVSTPDRMGNRGCP